MRYAICELYKVVDIWSRSLYIVLEWRVGADDTLMTTA